MNYIKSHIKILILAAALCFDACLLGFFEDLMGNLG